MNADLMDFVRRALEKGLPRERIAAALGQAGWSEADVRAALAAFAEVDFAVPVPRPRPYLPAQEVFTYALLFTAFYVSAFNLVALVFQFIDVAAPQPRFDGAPARLQSFEGARRNMAALIVAFPLFLFLFRNVQRGLARDPTQRDSKPRKWLTYLTLFVASAVLIGDVSGLVYRLLGGDLTVRFVLKALTVGVIAGGAFVFLLSDIRRGEHPPRHAAAVFLAASSVLVAAALVAGLWLVGGPGSARMSKFDGERLANLQRLAAAIDVQYAERGRLPGSLAELAAETRDLPPEAIQDPQTRAEYAYQATGPGSYQLCATFSRPSESGTPNAWRHGAGYACFRLEAPPSRTKAGR